MTEKQPRQCDEPGRKYWEIIADCLHSHGFSYGIAKHWTDAGMVFSVDAADNTGRRFIVKSDELLSAFLELEKALFRER